MSGSSEVYSKWFLIHFRRYSIEGSTTLLHLVRRIRKGHSLTVEKCHTSKGRRDFSMQTGTKRRITSSTHSNIIFWRSKTKWLNKHRIYLGKLRTLWCRPLPSRILDTLFYNFILWGLSQNHSAVKKQTEEVILIEMYFFFIKVVSQRH